MSLIHLNIGGSTFVTCKETLTASSSFFAAMFNDKMKPGHILDGAIFIDRSGTLFSHVLDYLRKGERWEPPSDQDVFSNLLDEAEFFGVDGMIDKISRKMLLVHLNVGGTTFITYKHTLTASSPFFAAIFSTRIPPKQILLNRDGALFAHVLNYLRNVDRWEPPSDPDVLLNLLDEAAFFGLDGLFDKIKQKVPPVQPVFEIYLKIENCTIISSAYTANTPDTVKVLLDHELNAPRSPVHSYVVYTDTYRNMIASILGKTSRNYEMTQISPCHGNFIMLIFNDRYNTALYTTLRQRLYLEAQ